MLKNAIPVIGGFTAFGAYALFHTAGIGVYKDIVQLYQKGIPVPLPSYVEERAQQALIDTKVEKPENFSFFYSFGQDLRYLGSTVFSKVIVSAPFNFGCKSRIDIDVSKINLPHSAGAVDWDSDAGSSFVASLILSENAQKFAFAEKILYTNQPYPFIYGGFAAIFVSLSGGLINEAYRIWTLKNRSRLARFNVIGLICSTTFLLLLSLRDTIHCRLQEISMLETIKINKDYLKGGLEYYEKVQIRNQALHQLLDGALYTKKGNVHSFLRTKNLPVSQRVDILTKAMKEAEEEEKAKEA